MRDVLCFFLSLIFCFSLIFAGGVSDAPALPPGRQAAWFGLFLPGMFAPEEEGDRVVFTWPVIDHLLRLLRLNG